MVIQWLVCIEEVDSRWWKAGGLVLLLHSAVQKKLHMWGVRMETWVRGGGMGALYVFIDSLTSSISSPKSPKEASSSYTVTWVSSLLTMLTTGFYHLLLSVRCTTQTPLVWFVPSLTLFAPCLLRSLLCLLHLNTMRRQILTLTQASWTATKDKHIGDLIAPVATCRQRIPPHLLNCPRYAASHTWNYG